MGALEAWMRRVWRSHNPHGFHSCHRDRERQAMFMRSCYAFTFICVLWQEIQKLLWDFKVISIRQTLWRKNYVVIHDKYAKIQNRCEDSACHQSLPLVPEMLMMLDPPTFRGSPRCEVPTRPHTVWCRSPIRYDGLVSIILRICLSSCLLAHESGILSLQTMRFVCLVSA